MSPFTPDEQLSPNDNFERLKIALTNVNPPVLKTGSSLGSGADGQIAYYVADSTNGVVWTFRYRAAASSNKWEFIGGPPLFASVNTAEGTSSASFTDLATAGPSITAPLAGDYVADWGYEYAAASVNGDSYCGLNINGGDPGVTVADPTIIAGGTGQPASATFPAARRRPITSVNAASAVKMRYRGGSGISTTFSRRWLLLTPIRVT